MGTATASYDSPQRQEDRIRLTCPANTVFFVGVMVAMGLDGALARATDAAGLRCIGKSMNECGAGDQFAVDRLPARYTNSAAHAITDAMRGQVCYIEDDTTVASTSTYKAPAGIVQSVTVEGGVSYVWVDPRPTAMQAVTVDFTPGVVGNVTVTEVAHAGSADTASVTALKTEWAKTQADLTLLINALKAQGILNPT